MDDKFREHIVKNVEKLIHYTDYDQLMHGCVSSGLLTPVMRRNVEAGGPLSSSATTTAGVDRDEQQLQQERHRRLFYKLTKRGPDAYQQLKMLLVDLKCDKAVLLLNVPLNNDNCFSLNELNRRNVGGAVVTGSKKSEEVVMNGNTPTNSHISKPATNSDVDGMRWSKSKTDDNDLPLLKEFTETIEPSVVHLVQKSKCIHVDPKVGIYPMRTEHNRGVFFMVNIIDFPQRDKHRSGAEEDSKSLLHLFKELGFKLFAYENLTYRAFFQLLEQIIDSKYTRDAECFVMALMTHGSMEDSYTDHVQFHDGSVVKVRDIENYFESSKCKNLADKPKIFIFPFCRGDIPDYGTPRAPVQTDSLVEALPSYAITIPTLSDILICYASTRGFTAHRDAVDGSWYIQKFCELMAKHAHDTAFNDIVLMIHSETAKLRTARGAMQTGSFQNLGFNKKLFFNPGFWEESN